MKRSEIKRTASAVERTCQFCGSNFLTYPAWIRKGGGRFCGATCLAGWRATPEGRAQQARNSLGGRKPSPRNRHGRVEDRERFNDPSRTCRWPGCDGRSTKLDQHHVVYRQHVRREGGDVWAEGNALALCASHHAMHHHQLTPLPLTALRDENYAYAFALLGSASYDYLRRRYAGADSRLEALLEPPDAERISA